MEKIQTVIEAFTKLYQLVATSALATSLVVAGLLLILITAILAVQFIRSGPGDLSTFIRVAFFSCLGLGVLLIMAGPAISWLEVTRGGIRQVPTQRSFANLGENSRVTWLLRLIPYDPVTEPQLAVSHLSSLGPPSQLYTFVASYHELRGYNVHEAVRMVGGSIKPGQRVSAIIFPVPSDLIPANARGMLQVISDIQTDHPDKVSKRLDLTHLTSDEQSNLALKSIPSWAFGNYSSHYPTFCTFSQTFRCESPRYSARYYLGDINDDWNPLGFANKSSTGHSPCETQISDAFCKISDWDDATNQFEMDFGARVFLVKQLLDIKS